MNKLSTNTVINQIFSNQNAWMEVILSNISDGVIIADKQENVIFVNSIVKKLLKYKDKDISDKHMDELIGKIKSKIDCDNNYSITNKCSSALDEIHEETECIKVFIDNVKDNCGMVIGKIAILPNIAECDKAHQIIHKMAHYDSLTGLANRALIGDSLNNMLAEAKITKSKIAVAFIDLDNFKLINDTMGHDVGDIILKKAGKIIKNCINENDFAGRLGGDEFIVIMPNIEKISEAVGEIRKLVQEINKTVTIDKKEFYLSASAGISIYPHHGEDPQSLIKNADTAMYMAKGTGKNGLVLFNSSMNLEISRKLEMINDLRNAIKNNEFSLHYQPLIDINTNSIIGMEALIRWNHPTKGIIPPLDFIPLAEETGLILQIGEWVLNEACRQNKEWQCLGYKPMRVSVNLSMIQFEHNGLVNTVKNALNNTGLEPKWLELEITESVALKCYDCAVQKINQLKEIGVFVSLDDFGTGYSSFNYLKQLPVDTLKIDKIFLDNLIPSSDDEFIMKTMINLARRLNLRVVAEGVESASQLEFLKKEKCNVAQGFLFSKPLSKHEFIKLIEEINAKVI